MSSSPMPGWPPAACACSRLAYREDDGTAPSRRTTGSCGWGWSASPIPCVRACAKPSRRCRRAGIRTVILTGDQAATAAAISRELELLGDGHPRTLDAAPARRMRTAHELRRLAREVDVFSRVSPADKYHIVRAFQANGEIVAMTGDGINDAAALRAADVGVAMGAGGTDMAREVADVVLLDDDLGRDREGGGAGPEHPQQHRPGAPVPALHQPQRDPRDPRRARDRRARAPISAMQFLWINLMSDVAPALALAVEPADPRDDDAGRPTIPRSRCCRGASLAGRVVQDAGLLAGAALVAHGIALARYGAGPRAPLPSRSRR